MDKDSIIINNKNFSLEIKNDRLILFIRGSESFIFENALDNARKQWLDEGKSKDELEKLIKKQGNKYIIYKPLEICTENTNDAESRESTQESSRRDEKSKQNDRKSKESSRKTLYIQDELSFKNCVFNAEVYFKYIAFTSLDSKESTQPLRIDFQHCKFHKRVYFTNCEFNGNVFFNHAVFERYADFHESIFNGVVSFYNAEFKYAPNFSTCVFQNLQATNFINVKIESLDFGKILYFIAEHINDDTYKKEVKSLKEKYSQKLQESKENQYDIDKEYKEGKKEATKKHRIRYASNARDSFRTIKNVLIANNNLLDACAWHKLELYAKEHEIDLKAPTKFSKEWIERIQLCFYRHTSAHHTDLLESIKSLLIVIGIFGVLSYAVIVCFSLSCSFWDYNPNILIKCYDKYIKCFLANHYCWALFINFVLFGVFIGIFIATIVCQKIRKYSFRFSCAITLALFITSPKYLIPPIEIFTDKRMLLDPLSVVGGVYSILFGFMLYSFIKTARKNSIIPN